MLKENSLTILNYVKDHDGEDLTAADIAEATGIPVKSVNPCINLLYREEVAITGGKVKYIRLTEEGRNFDPDAQEG